MKKISIYILFLLFYFNVSAQNTAETRSTRPLFSIGPEIGLPVGTNSEFYSTYFGISVKMEVPLRATPFSVTGTAGISNLNVKDKYQPPLDRTYRFVPLKLGGKYYFRPNFYGEAELGAAVSTEKTKNTALAYSAGIGTAIPFYGATDLDLGLRYEGWSETNDLPQQITFRVAIKF